MKVLLLVLMVSGVALAGRGGGGRKKTWYGPVASEAECEAAGRSSSVTFKTEDIASTLCRDISSQICVCLGPKAGKNKGGNGSARRNRNRDGEGEFGSVDFKFRCAKCTFKWNWKDAANSDS